MIQKLYLIKRPPPPYKIAVAHHPVIIATLKRVAEWESSYSGNKAWVWTQYYRNFGKDSGWLLTRWNGLIVDYGHIVRGFELPDGSQAGFWRDYACDEGSIKDLLPGAVWYSKELIPDWLLEKGVVYPQDDYTQQHILDIVADDGAMGWGREIPQHWVKAR